MLIPLCRDKVASLDLVFSPNQLKSLNSRLRRSWPSSAARSVIKTITYSVFSRKQIDSCWSHLMKEDVYCLSFLCSPNAQRLHLGFFFSRESIETYLNFTYQVAKNLKKIKPLSLSQF